MDRGISGLVFSRRPFSIFVSIFRLFWHFSKGNFCRWSGCVPKNISFIYSVKLGRENECIFPSNVSIFFLQVCFLPWKTTGEQSNLSILWMEAIILSAKAAVAINAIGDSVHSYDHQWLRCGVDSCLR